MTAGQLSIGNQPPHTVRLLKIIDDSVPPQPPSIIADLPSHAKIGESIQFSASAAANSVPALTWIWDFGDGVTATGTNPTHAWTHAGAFHVQLTVNGVDGDPYRTSADLNVTGTAAIPAPERWSPESVVR